jgi:arabinose-5-phosphate isomerase
LECKVDKEVCPLNLAPTTSTTAALVMGDAICAALMELKKFSKDDFAQFHPGGVLGRSLLTKAKDVMLTDVPLVAPEANLNEVLLRISEGRLGLVGVGTSTNIQGVITDGDIRRAMATTENHHALFARDMGSKTPIFIDENMGLSEMDRLFRERKIVTVLVGSPQQLKGVVQFYDIHG